MIYEWNSRQRKVQFRLRSLYNFTLVSLLFLTNFHSTLWYSTGKNKLGNHPSNIWIIKPNQNRQEHTTKTLHMLLFFTCIETLYKVLPRVYMQWGQKKKKSIFLLTMCYWGIESHILMKIIMEGILTYLIEPTRMRCTYII